MSMFPRLPLCGIKDHRTLKQDFYSSVLRCSGDEEETSKWVKNKLFNH